MPRKPLTEKQFTQLLAKFMASKTRKTFKQFAGNIRLTKKQILFANETFITFNIK